ncbi:MAG: type II secretion system protein [Elusimicrobiaceae bacterium]|nr:type II secretion system protein [Elusimicrobiaceae bacterium]
MKQRKRGFTLLEILVVIVIAMSALLIGVPMYKRSQDVAHYNTAYGILTELYTAVEALKRDLAEEDPDRTWPLHVSGLSQWPFYVRLEKWQNTSSRDYIKARDAATLKELNTDDLLGYALFARGYMQPVHYTGTTSMGNYGRVGDYHKYIFSIMVTTPAYIADTEGRAAAWGVRMTIPNASDAQFIGQRHRQRTIWCNQLGQVGYSS